MDTRQAKANTGNRIALGVLIILVCGFCFLCVAGALGGVGRMVSSVLVGFFGLAVFAYSVIGIIIGIAVTFNIRRKMPLPRAAFYFGLLALGIFALHIYTSSTHIVNSDYAGYLLSCYNNTNTAGGMLFGILAFPLMKAITSVGALSLVCVLFFAVAFFGFFPYIKKNVTYTSATKADRRRSERASRFSPSFRSRKTEGGAGTPIERPVSPTLTDLSLNGGDGLYVVDVEGDPLQKKHKKSKGAEGYNPLYPNAMGNYEDEVKIDAENKYSPRGLAKEILFSQNPDNESLQRFNTVNNPADALTNVGAPYSALRRNELRSKLGIDATESAVKESFLSRYRTEEKDSEKVGNAAETGSGSTSVTDAASNVDAKEFKENFYSLKEDQIRRFNEMYSNVKPEFESAAYPQPQDGGEAVRAENVKKEVVRPSRIMPREQIAKSPIDSTVEKAQNAVQSSASNLAGIQGAVARAITGEEVPQPKAKQELVAEAYERPSIKSYDTPVEKPKAKIPRAFADTAIGQPDAANADGKSEENGRDDGKQRHNAVLPIEKITAVQTPPTSASDNSVAQSGTAPYTSVRRDSVVGEQIKRAGREAPPLSDFERAEARKAEDLRAQKVRAARDRGMQKTEQLAKKLENIDAKKERLTQVNIDQAISQAAPKSPYVAPPLKLLTPPEPPVSQDDDYEHKKRALIETLAFFDIGAEVTDIMVGPTFSLYTLKVEMPKGRTIGSIVNLENDIAMKMEEESVRILAPIPGKNAVGIEVPNKHRRIVRLSELLMSPAFNQSKSPATFGLGKNLYGVDYVCDIKSLPHMLVAGATGAGKSCCINSIIISLLYKASPEDVRLILVDPKRVELSVYAGIPHLLLDEIVCDVDKAIRALNWAITEMNRRIEYLSNLKFRDIDEYNQDCERMGYEKMPRIIIIVDELADLMSLGKKAVEDSINRIARLARAVGIHLILATQRPSVDVVSGTIKNNLPSRVAFKVTSGPDSRTILDANGADKLLGNGDLLYMTPKVALPERMQGAFVSNSEVKAIVDFIKENNESYFDNSIKDAIFNDKPEEKSENNKERGKKQSGLPPELFDALRIGLDGAPLSISNMQRKLGLGWPKAAKIFDMMDDMGFLSPDEKDPKRKKVNISEQELDELIRDNMPEDDDE